MAPPSSGSNPFWISVSGYPADRAYLVYRFFLDIGHIVDKSFTDSNLMYLKYFSLIDCEVALSYDNQKIGYGGDIHVRIKPENPVLENPIIASQEYASCTATIFQPEPGTSGADETNVDSNDFTDSTEMNERNAPICVIEMVKTQSVQHANAEVSAPIGSSRVMLQVDSRKKVNFLQWLKQKVSYVFYFY
ncbi:hypothetical protein KR222_000432 [Zaprionus bogoriensis]|nr:hypothetical protein KR222_000432 [Zaprionus bogoriensis]